MGERFSATEFAFAGRQNHVSSGLSCVSPIPDKFGAIIVFTFHNAYSCVKGCSNVIAIRFGQKNDGKLASFLVIRKERRVTC